MSQDTCEVNVIDPERVDRARKTMPEDEALGALADTFKVLGDVTRLRILSALSTEELCVCDLAALTSVSSSAVSHQLRLLRTAKLVRCRKEGKMAFYSLDDAHVHSLYAEGLRHVREV